MPFTRDELKVVFPALLRALRPLATTPEGQLKLKQCGTSEDDMLEVINSAQVDALEDVGIPGHRMNELRYLGNQFKDDKEIMQALHVLAATEEILVGAAVSKNKGQIGEDPRIPDPSTLPIFQGGGESTASPATIAPPAPRAMMTEAEQESVQQQSGAGDVQAQESEEHHISATGTPSVFDDLPPLEPVEEPLAPPSFALPSQVEKIQPPTQKFMEM